MSLARPLVSVVDDDESVRESLPDLLKELGFTAEAFASAEQFLGSEPIGRTQCLIVDVNMPGMSGPELQRELTRLEAKIPIIFITADTDHTVRLSLLQQGAAQCLFKPFNDIELLVALQVALGTSA